MVATAMAPSEEGGYGSVLAAAVAIVVAAAGVRLLTLPLVSRNIMALANRFTIPTCRVWLGVREVAGLRRRSDGSASAAGVSL